MAKRFLLVPGVFLWLLISANVWAETFGDYEYSVSGGEVTITDYNGSGGNIVIPDTIDGMPVVGIFDNAFYNATGLTGVTIPASVNSIGFFVFKRCTDLSGITVDENNSDYSSLDGILYNKDKTELVTCPGGKAGTITIPGSVAFIGDDAFYSCTQLTGVTIPDSVVSIGSYAFYHCTGLTSVTIPDSVISIGTASFLLCTGLTEVTIGDGLDGIGDYAFDSCTSLTSLTIGSSVAIIGREAFDNCRSLTTVSIPAGVTDIHDYAFLACENLSVVYFLGNAPSTMGQSVFYSCLIDEPYCDPTTPDICYTSEATGFTTPFWEAAQYQSYPAAPCACSDDTDCSEGETCLNGACESDIDSDGIVDADDNCPDIANADQADQDNDGIGDVCDVEPYFLWPTQVGQGSPAVWTFPEGGITVTDHTQTILWTTVDPDSPDYNLGWPSRRGVAHSYVSYKVDGSADWSAETETVWFSGSAGFASMWNWVYPLTYIADDNGGANGIYEIKLISEDTDGFRCEEVHTIEIAVP